MTTTKTSGVEASSYVRAETLRRVELLEKALLWIDRADPGLVARAEKEFEFTLVREPPPRLLRDDLPRLLRAMADSEDAKQSGHDIIFNAAAKEIEEARSKQLPPHFDYNGPCKHEHYDLAKHGRRCTCGAWMVDFGD